MNPFGITPFSFDLIIKVLTAYEQVEQALIFGSRAKGNYQPGSDIDIAIKGNTCSDALAWSIQANLNENHPVPYFFDVVSYETLFNQALKEHIDRAGKVFYEQVQARR